MKPIAVVSTMSATELAAEREREEIALQRKRMADQIMYGSLKTRQDLSRQDSLPLNGGSRNGIYEEKHIEMTNRTDEGNLRSTVTPPLTSDSFHLHSSRLPSGLQTSQRNVQYLNQRTSS